MKETEYNKMLKAAIKITNNDERAKDLMHDVLIQLQTNNKYNLMNEKERLYFFIKSMQNQFYSNNSSFVRKYRRYSFQELEENFDVEEDIYNEEPTIDWIKQTLDTECKINPDFWYRKGIFELWLKHNGFIERVHKQTTIPRYEIKDVVKNMKVWLNIKWKQYKNEQN